eukprot:jgi/Mesvir1/25003/Mv16959-RA.1
MAPWSARSMCMADKPARGAPLRHLSLRDAPAAHGIVQDWDDMERLWRYVYDNVLQVQSEEHPVLMTEAPLNPRGHRERLAQVMFESFNVPSMFLSVQAVLALYASGRTTGLVLDVGDGTSHAVPVFEGFALPHAIGRVDVAGRDVTERLQLLLRKAGHSLTTSSEKEVVREIKEKLCYVAADPAAEEEAEASRQGGAREAYELPDGNTITLGAERFRAPEVLFRPSLIGSECPGVHQTVMDSIALADLDLRRLLYSTIVLSGGSTMFRGFGSRLLAEAKAGAPKGLKIRIFAPPERVHSTWIGGSILSSLTTFKSMWVTAEEWEESGAAALHRKSL